MTKGIYLVFVSKEVTNENVLENEEVIAGVDITTYIVPYDLETDFSEPKKVIRERKKKKTVKKNKPVSN